jgi:predicted acyl esterase
MYGSSYVGATQWLAATNRHDDATAAALKLAAADATRWLAFRRYQALPALQPTNLAVAQWYFVLDRPFVT